MLKLKIDKYTAVLNSLKLRQGCEGFSSFLSPVSLAIKKVATKVQCTFGRASVNALPSLPTLVGINSAARLGAQIKINIPIIFMLVLYFNFNFKCLAQMPESDVWLFKIKTNKQNQKIVFDSLNITNRKGYDNQPSFSADEKCIYYVSVREDNQSDIYIYNINNKKTKRLTNTIESEYSPQLNSDGLSISAVTVEKDSSQKIHMIDALKGNLISSLNFDSVGYYQYLNKDTLIYYKLTNPHSLRMHVIKSGEDKWLSDNPIRGFKTINRSQLLFGIKDSVKVNFYIYDFLLQKAVAYCSYRSTNEDAFWHPQLGLLKSEGPKILRYHPVKKEWVTEFDLSAFRIKKITRVLIDSKNKYLVIVNNNL